MNEILNMSRKEQVTYWVGRFCLAIGSGNLSSEVHHMIDLYQREAYERGRADGKQEITEMF